MSRPYVSGTMIAVGLVAWALLRFYPPLLAYVVLAGAIALGLGVAYIFGYDALWLVSSRLSPVRQVRARVRRSHVVGLDTYSVVFTIQGREREFYVPEQAYIRCEDGTEGLLVFRGEQFKHFIPDPEN